MSAIVGFSTYRNLSAERNHLLSLAQNQALSHFEWLGKKSLVIGETRLDLWGHGEMTDRVYTLPDGSTVALIGSPHNTITWQEVEKDLLEAGRAEDFRLPWDGRVILLQVSADGKRWTMWNDWLGSIPVFHAEIDNGHIASTLEPVTVAAAGYTSNDFFMPGLVSLLINGHLISDWTFYKGMKTVPADSVSEWDGTGFSTKQLWTVQPSQSRWETSWDDLVDEMHELSHKAIADTLKTQSTWILPLSSGLDSRLIAGVAADEGVNVYTYTYGELDATDVVYSKKIAKALGFPWKHIELPKDFLVKYTPQWADWYGSSLHFHGMYQMSFLDGIEDEPIGPILSGLIGDTLTGGGISESLKFHRTHHIVDQVERDWFVFWKSNILRSAMKVSIDEAIEANVVKIRNLKEYYPGAFSQKLQFLRLWGRQRFFTSYQANLSDYWRGVASPFMDRRYARFCLSLPQAALDDRRLIKDVYRCYYGRLAVIPGTYANEPLILTGRYLLNRRIAKRLPKLLRRGPFSGYENIQLRMDIESLQVTGKDALWPLFETKELLSDWLDFSQLEQDYQTLMNSKKDIRPLRRLQSVQTLAYRLMN